ncbi:hypothetical protein PVK06_042920 [Gossypium arboreum]|uniref:Uncharacterized protein n=1 Tax=Gossypium arboreum TaxID=29729 RepID=A0ABR0MMI3_GOSAR|nr:hypothetical protein PVK06_042920 [Gossypium arboreum]
MGASESSLAAYSLSSADQISTISQRSETVDPILEKLKSLRITSPILTTPPTDGSLTDILVRRPSSSSSQAAVNPKVFLELLSAYRDWQEEKAQTICKKQEDIEYKIEVADALTVKLLQSLNHSVSTMKTASQHLAEGNSTFVLNNKIHTLQVELGELKERLTEVLSNYEPLCNRIAAGGPEPLRSIKPFAVSTSNSTSLSSGKVNL